MVRGGERLGSPQPQIRRVRRVPELCPFSGIPSVDARSPRTQGRGSGGRFCAYSALPAGLRQRCPGRGGSVRCSLRPPALRGVGGTRCRARDQHPPAGGLALGRGSSSLCPPSTWSPVWAPIFLSIPASVPPSPLYPTTWGGPRDLPPTPQIRGRALCSVGRESPSSPRCPFPLGPRCSAAPSFHHPLLHPSTTPCSHRSACRASPDQGRGDLGGQGFVFFFERRGGRGDAWGSRGVPADPDVGSASCLWLFLPSFIPPQIFLGGMVRADLVYIIFSPSCWEGIAHSRGFSIKKSGCLPPLPLRSGAN